MAATNEEKPLRSETVPSPGEETKERSVDTEEAMSDIPETMADGFKSRLTSRVKKLVKRIKHGNKPKPIKSTDVPLIEECPRLEDAEAGFVSEDSTGSDSDIDIQPNEASNDSPEVWEWRGPVTVPNDAYDCNHFRRGVAVLIVNTEFANIKDNRPDAEHDIENLNLLFKVLDFEVIVLKNKTTKALMDSLIDIRSKLEVDSDCFACLISTHGGEIPVRDYDNLRQHALHTFDGTILTDDIVSTFNDDNCPAMRGKPKLFFVQACRGRFDVVEAEMADQGVNVDIIAYDIQHPVKGTGEGVPHTSQHQGSKNTHNSSSRHRDGSQKDGGSPKSLPSTESVSEEEKVREKVDNLQITGEEYDVTSKPDTKGMSDDNPARRYAPGDIPFIDDEVNQIDEEERRRHQEACLRYQKKLQLQEQILRDRILALELKHWMKDGDYCSVPCYKHCLVMFSSAPERLAWCDSGIGGWLPHCMYMAVYRLHKCDFQVDLLQVLTEVNNYMAVTLQTNIPSKPEWHQSKSAACIYHMLTKDIYFRIRWNRKLELVTDV